MAYQRLERAGFYYGFPVLLMTTKDREGRDALTPLSSSWVLGNTVVLGIGFGNKGFQNLEQGSDLVLNLPDESLFEQVKRIETFTGLSPVPERKREMGYTYCADKFAAGGFTKMPAVTVRSVRVPECPIHIEARVEGIVRRDWFAIVTCDMTGIFVDTKLLHDAEHIDTRKWHPLLYKFREYTGTGARLGLNFGFAEA